MISTRVSRASAFVQLAAGGALLFASGELLPRAIADFPAGAAWVGQMLGAAWLGFAALNWIGRSALLGGIYNRGVVLANAGLYFITSMVMLKPVMRGPTAPATWALFGIALIFTVIYGWLLYRGPVEADLEAYRGSASQR
jgi:hypothetical protein